MSAHAAEEWIKKGEDNCISAVDLMRRKRKRVFDVVCNQCQQCAEKYLKAILVRHNLSFPKTHGLTELEELVAQVEPNVRLIHAALDILDPYAVDIRYPGLQATEQEAKGAIKAMKEVRSFARARLGLGAR